MKKFARLRDLGVSFSLANLFFITSWKELVFVGDYHYFDPGLNPASRYLALFADVLILTVVFLGLIICSNADHSRWQRRLGHIAFLIAGILAFGPLSFEAMSWLYPETHNYVNYPVPMVVFVLCLLISVPSSLTLDAITNNLKLIALFLLPFSLLILVESIKEQVFTDRSLFEPSFVQNEIPQQRQSRLHKKVVWIIFDELDLAAFAAAKHNNTPIPGFDRFGQQSVVALNAFAPNNRTQDSIPALLTGVPLEEAIPVSARDLQLYPADGSAPFSFGDSDNIFATVKKLGGTSAVTGWYHPYSRVFLNQVAACFWSPQEIRTCSGASGLTKCGFGYFVRGLVAVPGSDRIFRSLAGINDGLLSESTDVQSERNEYLTGKAEELIDDPRLNLLYFHFSIPHSPWLAKTNLGGDENYFTSLEIADHTLAHLREKLEKAGQWDNTVVIVSSDHYFRLKTPADFVFLPEDERRRAVSDRRIPFMIKLAGQSSRIGYDPVINTVVTKKLILDIFADKVRTPEELILWLDRFRAEHPDLIDRKNVGRKW